MKIKSDGANVNQVNATLENLLHKRNGGAVNFRGVHYQMLYACYALLSELSDSADGTTLTMEGIEDIDVNTTRIVKNSNYIQIKSSINKMDAGTFWDLGVLQNFADAYLINPESRFKLVYNMRIASGHLASLIGQDDKKGYLDYWLEKLKAHNANFDHKDFLGKVSFEFQDTNELYSKILSLLYQNWDLNNGTEQQFLTALFYHILLWSKDRKTIAYNDLNIIFQQIKDSFSIAPVNEAVRYGWITKVGYNVQHTTTAEDYYDGKSARPVHISLGLPVRRKTWEKEIHDNLKQSDVVLIKSSSGQGKSTLAWQTGFNHKEYFSVYQLHSCKNINEANAIVDFLETRFLIGEIPLIIIDGLNHLVGNWAEVVQRTSDKVAKYIVTAREEDWFRYGADISRINLKPIDISLSMPEAKDIFEQLKMKGKIHGGIREWQPVWEMLNQKGLLIEYAYLLTKGQMIHERLATQIKNLNESRSAAAKLEILRMTSLADCLNIKLRTADLIDYIKKEIGFDQDRGQILNELEKEYFLKFDAKLITGLHPVRSSHLKDLLHINLPIECSLINLHKIVDDDYKYDFFINSSLMLTDANKDSFLDALAKSLAEREFSEMVFALDGLMHSEPQRYWDANRNIFDDAYTAGAIEIFTLATVPFTKLNTLDELSKLNWDKGSTFKVLAELKSKMPSFSFENSSVVLFAKSLHKYLAKRTSPAAALDGLEFLMKWYRILKMPFILKSIDHNVSIDDLVKMDIGRAKELMLYYQLADPAGYKVFTSQNEDILISYLKYHTNSLTIQSLGKEISINYLLFANEVEMANEFSVFRIEVVQALLPHYETYSTEAILLPFPSEELISVSRDNSRKHLTSEAIGDKFDQHLNAIWKTTILKNYNEDSVYNWQKNNLHVRKLALGWARNIIQIVDSLLEANIAKQKLAAGAIDNNINELANAVARKKAYPNYENKYFEKTELNEEERVIEKWFGALGAINSQTLNIFLPKDEHSRHIAIVNLKTVCYDLIKMQDAFKVIEDKTFAYFDHETVCTEENKVYERLYSTVKYYVSRLPLESKQRVRIGRTAVEQWWQVENGRVLNNLKKVLGDIHETFGYHFVLPNSLFETPTLTYCTFGVADFDFSDSDAFFNLSVYLAPIAELPCDFYTIVSIKDRMAIGAFRFSKKYFKAFNDLRNGESNISLEGLTPIPLAPDENIISYLPEIMLSEASEVTKNKEKQLVLLFDLWKLSEFRTRLNKESEIEMNWLREMEGEYIPNICGKLNELTNPSDSLTRFVNGGIAPNFTYTSSQIMEQLFECVKT